MLAQVADRAEDGDFAGSEQTQGNNKSERLRLPAKPGEQTAVHENIASADLQNPSDALKILAQVADRAKDDDSPESEQTQPNKNQPKQFRPAPPRQDHSPPKVNGYIHYKPVQDGIISPEMVYQLFSRFDVALYFALLFLHIATATKNSFIPSFQSSHERLSIPRDFPGCHKQSRIYFRQYLPWHRETTIMFIKYVMITCNSLYQ